MNDEIEDSAANARDVITEGHRQWWRDPEAVEADVILQVLRDAAGAQPHDTITIGPDGAVGRLEESSTVQGRRVKLYRVVTRTAPPAGDDEPGAKGRPSDYDDSPSPYQPSRLTPGGSF